MAHTPRQTLLPRVEEEETFSSGCLSPHWQRNLLQELQNAQSISAVVNVPGSLQPSSVFSFLTDSSPFASLEDPGDFSPRRASAGGTAQEISLSDFDGYFDSLKEELCQFGAICTADREAAAARHAGGSLLLSARRRENAELLVASTRRMQRSRVPLGPQEALRGERSSPLTCSNEGAEDEELPLEDVEARSRLLAETEDARSVEAGGVDEEKLFFLCDEEDELDAADACSSVPECFFSPDFQLSDFLGYDLPEALKVHDELSTCLDEVECSLVALLSRRFSFFVRSLWMLTSLQTEIDGALRTVAALRGEFKKMQAERVELGLKVLRLTKERQGLLVYLRRMEFLSYVRDCMQSLEILQQAKEFATCLRLIEATRAVMTEELAALHVARPIRLQLDELQHRITRSLIDDFAAASLTAVFPPNCDAQSPTLVSALLNVLNSPLSSSSSSPPSLSSASLSSSSPSPPLSSHAIGAARLLEPWIRRVASTDSLLHLRSASERPDEREESRGVDESEVTSALAVLYGDWARGWTLGIEEEDANPFDDRGVFTWEQRLISCVGLAAERLLALNLVSRCEGNASMMIARARHSFSSATKSAMRTVAARAVVKYSCASGSPHRMPSLSDRLSTEAEEEQASAGPQKLRAGSSGREPLGDSDPRSPSALSTRGEEGTGGGEAVKEQDGEEGKEQDGGEGKEQNGEEGKEQEGGETKEQQGGEEVEEQEGEEIKEAKGEQEAAGKAGGCEPVSRFASREETGEFDESEGRETGEAVASRGGAEASVDDVPTSCAATASDDGETVKQSDATRGPGESRKEREIREAAAAAREKHHAERPTQDGHVVGEASAHQGDEEKQERLGEAQRDAAKRTKPPLRPQASVGFATQDRPQSIAAVYPASEELAGPRQLAEALATLDSSAFSRVWRDCLGFCLAVARRLEAWTLLVLLRTIELSLAARLRKEECSKTEREIAEGGEKKEKEATGGANTGKSDEEARQGGAERRMRKNEMGGLEGGAEAPAAEREEGTNKERKEDLFVFTASQAESLGKRVDGQTRQWRIIAADLARLAEMVVQALVSKCSSMLQLRAEPQCMQLEQLAQLYWTSLSAVGCLYTLQERFHKRLTEVLLQSLRVTVRFLLSADQSALLSPGRANRGDKETKRVVHASSAITGLEEAPESEEEDAIGCRSFLRPQEEMEAHSAAPLHLQVDNLSLQLAAPAAASLKAQLFVRAKALLESFHEAKLAQVNVILENETWERAEVPVSFAATLEVILQFPFFFAPPPCSSLRCPSRRQKGARESGQETGVSLVAGASAESVPGKRAAAEDARRVTPFAPFVANREQPRAQLTSGVREVQTDAGDSPEEVEVCACACWSCSLASRSLTINDETFAVVPACLLTIHIVSEYLSLLRLLPLLLPFVLPSVAHVLQHFSRVSLQLTVEGGAVKRGRLPRITAAALALCARSCACIREVLTLLLCRIDNQQKNLAEQAPRGAGDCDAVIPSRFEELALDAGPEWLGDADLSASSEEASAGCTGERIVGTVKERDPNLVSEAAKNSSETGRTRVAQLRAEDPDGDAQTSPVEEEPGKPRGRDGEREQARDTASRRRHFLLAPVPPLLRSLPKPVASQMGLTPVDPHSRASQVLQQTCQVLAGAQAKVYQKIGDILIDRYEVHSARWLSTPHSPSMVSERACSSMPRTQVQADKREDQEGKLNLSHNALSNGCPEELQQIPAPPPHDALKGFVKDASSLYKVLHRLLPADAVSKVFARTFHQISYRFETRLSAAFSHQPFASTTAPLSTGPPGLFSGPFDGGAARENPAVAASDGPSSAAPEGMQRSSQGAEEADKSRSTALSSKSVSPQTYCLPPSAASDTQAAGGDPQAGASGETSLSGIGDAAGKEASFGSQLGASRRNLPGADATLSSAGSRKEGGVCAGSLAPETQGNVGGARLPGGCHGSPARGPDAVQLRINWHLNAEKNTAHAVYGAAQGETMGDRYWLDCLYLYENLCRFEGLRTPLLHLVRDLLSAGSKCWTVSPGVAELVEQRLPTGD
ncbi:UNVERIFIED_CONTAM: Vps54 family protein [Hammondia hammondi]|eukprot:XP_008888133.1 Vps54 family protein [Hammondia hammondi]